MCSSDTHRVCFDRSRSHYQHHFDHPADFRGFVNDINDRRSDDLDHTHYDLSEAS